MSLKSRLFSQPCKDEDLQRIKHSRKSQRRTLPHSMFRFQWAFSCVVFRVDLREAYFCTDGLSARICNNGQQKRKKGNKQNENRIKFPLIRCFTSISFTSDTLFVGVGGISATRISKPNELQVSNNEKDFHWYSQSSAWEEARNETHGRAAKCKNTFMYLARTTCVMRTGVKDLSKSLLRRVRQCAHWGSQQRPCNMDLTEKKFPTPPKVSSDDRCLWTIWSLS